MARRARVGTLRSGPRKRVGPLVVNTLVGEGPFSVHRFRMAPGARHPAIRHRRTTEFFFVVSGSMRAYLDGRRVRFKAGKFGWLPPGTAHAFSAGKDGVEVLAVFSPAFSLEEPDVARVG